MRRLPRVIALLTLVSATVVLVPLPAGAAQAGYATFAALAGAPNDYTSTMRQRPVGFPAAQVQSSSGSGSAIGVQGGTSTFLAATTPVGARYGSSRGASYLNLRAEGGRQSGRTSTTTYTFAQPTPASGWTFVLGDIDADQVQIKATRADGRSLTAAQLGFRGTFNYCATGAAPRPSTCGTGPDTDQPTWVPATALLVGNAAAEDTAGASAWFEPGVPVSSLTFVYTLRAGSPVFQTWFSALAHDLTGTVTAPAGQADGLTLRLLDPAGNPVGTTTTAADGSYSFPDLATYDGYRLDLVRPDGLTSDDPLSRSVDLSRDDQVQDFALRAVIPAAVSGVVLTGGADPVADVLVTVTGPDGYRATTRTRSDGSYLFDQTPAGDGYQISIAPPEGFVTDPTSRGFDIPPGSDDPITGQDFTLSRLAETPSYPASGTVRDSSGAAVPDVRLVLTPTAGGTAVPVRTRADGTWEVDDLPEGDYTVVVTPPAGFRVDGDADLSFSVSGAGVDGLDFVLVATATTGPTSQPTGGATTEPATVTTTTSGPAASPRTLAATGAPTGSAGLAVAGLMLVGVGAVLLSGRRPRRRW